MLCGSFILVFLVSLWGNKIGKPHTIPCKLTGKCDSVTVRLIPAPRGTGIVSAPVPKKLLQMAGVEDCYTSSKGSTCTLGNFAKATFAAIAKTYSYLTPDLWPENVLTKTSYQEFSDFLSAIKPKKSTGSFIHIDPEAEIEDGMARRCLLGKNGDSIRLWVTGVARTTLHILRVCLNED
ncbi:40S ribosomal protein S2-like [Harmonia axyridis]|uniref:40S ribosomal protein S2-like n=1 Tax=Harmonia axyridis TaxID=115357 RepID=UPI001E276070|nr:40S ribosomal protein S2-like [Harmonia axyridis]